MSVPDFKYIRPWFNNKASIELDGRVFDVYQTAGKGPLSWYVGKHDGVEVATRKKMFPLVRALAKFQPQSERLP